MCHYLFNFYILSSKDAPSRNISNQLKYPYKFTGTGNADYMVGYAGSEKCDRKSRIKKPCFITLVLIVGSEWSVFYLRLAKNILN